MAPCTLCCFVMSNPINQSQRSHCSFAPGPTDWLLVCGSCNWNNIEQARDQRNCFIVYLLGGGGEGQLLYVQKEGTTSLLIFLHVGKHGHW